MRHICVSAAVREDQQWRIISVFYYSGFCFLASNEVLSLKSVAEMNSFITY